MIPLQAGKHQGEAFISVEQHAAPLPRPILAPKAHPKAPQAQKHVLDRYFASKVTRGTVPNNDSSGSSQKRC